MGATPPVLELRAGPEANPLSSRQLTLTRSKMHPSASTRSAARAPAGIHS